MCPQFFACGSGGVDTFAKTVLWLQCGHTLLVCPISVSPKINVSHYGVPKLMCPLNVSHNVNLTASPELVCLRFGASRFDACGCCAVHAFAIKGLWAQERARGKGHGGGRSQEQRPGGTQESSRAFDMRPEQWRRSSGIRRKQ